VSDAADPQSDPAASLRKFLSWLVRGFLSLWGLGFAWVFAAFVRPPRSSRSLTERVLEVGDAESLAVGQGKLVRHGSEPIWVVRRDQDNFVGLSGVCTHMHCVLKWSEEQQILLCPCHDGSFDINGNVLGGPPQRALARHSVESQLGKIYVHL